MSEKEMPVYENEYAQVYRVSGSNKTSFDVIIKGSGKLALTVKDRQRAISYAKRLLQYSPLYQCDTQSSAGK